MTIESNREARNVMLNSSSYQSLQQNLSKIIEERNDYKLRNTILEGEIKRLEKDLWDIKNSAYEQGEIGIELHERTFGIS
jgi:hypothetical protein